MTIQAHDILKILLAILLGGLIGIEREAKDKSAGFRTIIMISLGSAVFTMMSLFLSKSDDPTRIAASIVAGIGFLGAGSILRVKDHISGLTTAATIWLAAAIGLVVGGGNYLLAVVVTLLALVVLWLFPILENKASGLRTVMTYEIVCASDMDTIKALETTFRKYGLKIDRRKRTKAEDKVTIEYVAFGPPDAHERLIDALLQDDEILELSY